MRTLLLFLLLCFAKQASAQCNAVIYNSTGNFICDGYAGLFSSLGDTYQWYLDGVAISNANDYFYAATIPGTYTVEVDSVGCVAMSAGILLTLNNSPDTPGIITASNSIFCEGTTQTFSIDPVPNANSYTWHSNSIVWPAFGDTTNVATIVAGVSQGSLGATIISVYAVNECGSSAPSTKTVYVHGPPQIGGHDPNPDMIANNIGAYCPKWGDVQLHPTIHGNPGGYTSPVTFQWYLGNNPIPGETDQYLTINRGGNYSVKIITDQCGTFTVPKVVHQRVPVGATITPQGPLDFCLNNVQPLNVTFDMTGVDGSFNWVWFRENAIPGFYQYNVYSAIPDSMGYYDVVAYYNDPLSGECRIVYPGVTVTMPSFLDVTQIDDTLFATPGYSSYQWYESGAILPGATTQNYVLTYDGIYSVVATFMNGCVESSDTIDPVYMPPPPPPPPAPPGYNPQEPGEEMTIAPNPVSGSFVLYAKTSKDDETADICITDAMGKILFEKNVIVVDGVVKEKIDLPDGVNFIGFLKLRSKSTGKTIRFNKQ